MSRKVDTQKNIALFESREIRRTWHNEQWYFVMTDVIKALTDSVQPDGYIKDMHRRDEELAKGWGQIATPLSIETNGGPQKLNCANLQGIFRIIQSIPSPKAEPFKVWLAKVGQERIEEIQNPELAMDRAKRTFERRGYPKGWIDKRMRGINVRHTLTDEWKNRGIEKSSEFAILTDEIYKGTFGLTTQDYKKYKNLDIDNNLRDHMDDMELILTMLGEATTTRITQDKDSRGFPDLRGDAAVGGSVARRTRLDIESQTGKKVVTENNFLNLEKSKKLLINKKKK